MRSNGTKRWDGRSLIRPIRIVLIVLLAILLTVQQSPGIGYMTYAAPLDNDADGHFGDSEIREGNGSAGGSNSAISQTNGSTTNDALTNDDSSDGNILKADPNATILESRCERASATLELNSSIVLPENARLVITPLNKETAKPSEDATDVQRDKISGLDYVLGIVKRAADKFLDEEEREESSVAHDVQVVTAFVTEIVDEKGCVVQVPDEQAKLTYTFDVDDPSLLNGGGRALAISRDAADSNVSKEEVPAWTQSVSSVADEEYATEKEASHSIQFKATAQAADQVKTEDGDITATAVVKGVRSLAIVRSEDAVSLGTEDGQTKSSVPRSESAKNSTPEEELTSDDVPADGVALKAASGPLRAAGDSSSLPNIVYTGINNPANTTIDLFDYWITSQSDDDHDSSAPAASGYYGGTVYNRGINKDHLLLFHGGADGQHPGRNAADDFTGMYSGNPKDAYKSPSLYWGPVIQGIVKNTLENGYPVLSDNGKKSYNAINARDDGPKDPRNKNLFMASNGSPYTLSEPSSSGAPENESLAYLFDPSMTGVAGRASYHDVNGLFSVDAEGFYLYDSGRQAAHYNETSKRFELTNHASGKNGFWPLDDYRTADQLADGKHNDYSGMHMNMSFSIPANGEVLNPQGQYVPMTFTFAGDDDVWVFIDDVLVGDVGGIHQPSSLQINFQNGDVNVNRNFDGITCPAEGTRGADKNSAEYVAETNLKTIFSNADKAGADSNWNDKRFADGTYHKIDFFYLERGNNESNLQIRFNMVNTADFTAHKALESSIPNETLKHDQFQFELVGLNGRWRRDSNGVATPQEGNTEAIRPNDAESFTNSSAIPGPGDVSRYYHTENGKWVYRVGVSADGNVNFGNADFSLVNEEGGLAVGDAFRYIVREVRPSDLPSDSGYVYDSRIYYMEATIAHDDAKDQYYLRKRYYTDDTFTTQVEDTSYISFVNKHDPSASPSIDVSKTLVRGETPTDITAGQFAFELLNADETSVLCTASCGASSGDGKIATATLTPPRLTPIDFDYAEKTITREYTVRESIPVEATDNGDGTYTKDDIVYHQSKYKATLKAEYDGNSKITWSFSYTYAEDEEASVDALSYSNTVRQVDLVINKTNAQGDPLVGSKFKIYKDYKNPADQEALIEYNKAEDYTDAQLYTDFYGMSEFVPSDDTGTTDTKATVRVRGIMPGTYWVIETEAPDGYVARGPDNPIRLDVATDGNWTMTTPNDASDEMISFVAKTYGKQDTDSGYQADNVLTVKNVRVYLLPATDGPGSLTFTFAGSFIVALAALIYLNSRRKAQSSATDVAATDRGR